MDDTSDHQWSQYNQGRILGLGQIQAPAAAERRTACSRPHQHQKNQAALNCPRCDSTNTKFCYYNNYSLSQPRYFCKTCRRYWTAGGTLRNVPVGGGSRKNKKILSSSSASTANAINIPPAFYKLDQAGGASQFGPEPQLGSLFGGGSFGLVRELIMGGPAAAAGDKAGVVQLGDPTFFWNGGAGNIGGSCMNVFSQD